MKKLRWTKDMSLGNEKLDQQHKAIISYFNKLGEQLSSSRGIDLAPVRESIDFMSKYIRDHFTYEEGCMRKLKIPGSKKHIEIHKILISIFKTFNDDFNKIYRKPSLSSLDLERLMVKFEHDVIEKYIYYMAKEAKHFHRYRKKFASC